MQFKHNFLSTQGKANNNKAKKYMHVTKNSKLYTHSPFPQCITSTFNTVKTEISQMIRVPFLPC